MSQTTCSLRESANKVLVDPQLPDSRKKERLENMHAAFLDEYKREFPDIKLSVSSETNSKNGEIRIPPFQRGLMDVSFYEHHRNIWTTLNEVGSATDRIFTNQHFLAFEIPLMASLVTLLLGSFPNTGRFHQLVRRVLGLNERFAVSSWPGLIRPIAILLGPAALAGAITYLAYKDRATVFPPLPMKHCS
ncbi:MAG: hypothetical protein HYT77_06040 [Deltaproteobacteria bacterium]|nr:hypothetical protein [Deltaproteobacteria bacterium]